MQPSAKAPRPRQLRSFRQLAMVAVPLAVAGLGLYMIASYLWAWREVRQAEKALSSFNYPAARAHLNSALNAWGDSPEIVYLAARTARRAGDFDAAEKHLRECQRLGGAAKHLELEWALLEAQRGRLKEAEGYLVACVEDDHPDTEIILEVLTPAYMRSYSVGNARRCVNRLLELNPNHVEGLIWRAEMNERSRSMNEAIQDLRQALTVAPSRDDAKLKLAQLLVEKHQPEEARQLFEQLQASAVDRAAVELGLARCLWGLGQQEEAKSAIDALLRKSPNDIDALAERARFAQQSGQLPEAETFLRRAAAISPHNREVIYNLGVCLQQQGKTEEGLKYTEQFKQIEADLKKLRELTTQISERPRDAGPRFEAGSIFLRTGQEREALRWFASALQEEPGHRPTHLALAEYYDRTGQSELARQHRQAAGK